MAITLRNKRAESDIRFIGERTGEGPSAVISRIAAEERARIEPVEDRKARAEERYRRITELLDSFPPWTEEELAASRAIEQDMYDEDGLPK